MKRTAQVVSEYTETPLSHVQGHDVSPGEMRQRMKIKALQPDARTVEKHFGRYRKRVRDPITGGTTEVLRVPLREGDNRTRAGNIFREMYEPLYKARGEISANRPMPTFDVARDAAGGLRYLREGQQPQPGWKPRVTYARARVERGDGGMLWRQVGGEWMPLGVHCLGTPIKGSARIPRRGIQYSPDGVPYVWRRADGWTPL